jgi:hypothetical protein
VIGTTLLAFPETSNEVFGSLSKPLTPGWYALVFGSGLFDANGFGVAVNNGIDIRNPTYIAWQLGAVNQWSNLTNPIFRNFHFVVQGQVVPEPSIDLMLVVLLFGSLVQMRNRQRMSRQDSSLCFLVKSISFSDWFGRRVRQPMYQRVYYPWLAILSVVGPLAGFAPAEIIYESGHLGPTGIPQGAVDAANVNAFVFNGVRFNLTSTVVTTQVGGHFVGPVGTTGTLFGAVIKLVDENDFPDSRDLSTPDVLGSTTLAFPEPSAEVFGNLSLALDPGWYTLVFGSGLFGATGNGAMPLNNPDIGNPTYIGLQPGGVSGWGDLLNPIFQNYRFVVRGEIVPETSSIALLLFGFLNVVNKRVAR